MECKLLGLVLMLPVVLCSVGTAMGQASREIRQTFPLSSDGKVAIDTYKGSVTVESWDTPEVDILVSIECDEGDSDAEKKVRDTEIHFDASPNSVRMRTDYDKVKWRSFSFFGLFRGKDGSLPFVHYTLKMPRTAHLTIKDYKSDVRVSDLGSSMDVNTYKGSVRIDGLAGSLDLETYKGDVDIGFSEFCGDSRVETYKGRIAIQLPSDSGFELDADLGRKGSLDSDFEIRTTLRDVRGGERSYRGTVHSGGPVLRISTYKGKIRLLRK